MSGGLSSSSPFVISVKKSDYVRGHKKNEDNGGREIVGTVSGIITISEKELLEERHPVCGLDASRWDGTLYVVKYTLLPLPLQPRKRPKSHNEYGGVIHYFPNWVSKNRITKHHHHTKKKKT